MSDPTGSSENELQLLPKGTVLIAGGGPVGLLVARILSFYGVKSILFERNETTTKWPKMDLTNSRSMEFFRKLGLAEDLRKQGVPPNFDQNVLISSGLSTEKPITAWELPGVDKLREQIQQNNDGTQPGEPWQRLSQALFEKWLKAICEKDPLIDLRYSHKVETVVEDDDIVKATVLDIETGVRTVWGAEYMAACDGAGSKTRKSLGIPLDGGPVPSFGLLVHFKSNDLARLHKYGRFWHIVLPHDSGDMIGFVISQDEKDTFTTHLFLPLDAEPDKIDTYEAVYRVLGGLHAPYEIKIDEILVRSVWRPNIALTRHWQSPKLRIFLAGDSAHQNIPTGGYGMNTGIGDAMSLGWKLASVINGHGGIGLLKSYEIERRPVAHRNIDRSGVHFQVHARLGGFLAGGDPRRVDGDDEEGRSLRQQIHEHYQTYDGENKDWGIELDYRYSSPIIIRREDDGDEPHWNPRVYTPSTWPGARPPHIFLSDGTPIFDKFGKHWSLLVFTSSDVGQSHLVKAGEGLSLPLTVVDLSGEELAKKLYERSLLLIRPDQHCAWRAESVDSLEEAEKILSTVTGRIDFEIDEAAGRDKPAVAFAATVGMTTQVDGFTLDHMAAFQS